jgi:hypothetical protein
VTKPGSPNNGMVVCRYCALESAVSHASVGECIDELQHEVTRLKDHLLRGRPRDGAGVHATSEPLAERAIERAGGRGALPPRGYGREAAMVSLALLKSNR